MPVPKAIDQAVRLRAQDRCEYCRVPQSASRLRFWIDHVIATQHLGTDALDNLALACPFCNRHKGPNVGGFDLPSTILVPLYRPRRDIWGDHLQLREGLLPACPTSHRHGCGHHATPAAAHHRRGIVAGRVAVAGHVLPTALRHSRRYGSGPSRSSIARRNSRRASSFRSRFQ